MNWIIKLIDMLKIPFKILLPTACLFSAIMTFANDALLKQLNLLEWNEKYGFTFGLLFLITFCLIAIYILKEILSRTKSLLKKILFKRKTMLAMLKMNPLEVAIIAKLYNSPGYTTKLDFNEPVVKDLEYKNYIYSGGVQAISMGWNNEMLMKYTLQPFVFLTLDHYKTKIKDRINKLKLKLSKETNVKKTNRLEEDLEVFENINEMIFNGGFEND